MTHSQTRVMAVVEKSPQQARSTTWYPMASCHPKLTSKSPSATQAHLACSLRQPATKATRITWSASPCKCPQWQTSLRRLVAKIIPLSKINNLKCNRDSQSLCSSSSKEVQAHHCPKRHCFCTNKITLTSNTPLSLSARPQHPPKNSTFCNNQLIYIGPRYRQILSSQIRALNCFSRLRN